LKRITFVLFLLLFPIIMSACGQYGDLYMPTEETAEPQSEDEEKN
jgi:predicted small lipoprotein YifL